MARQFRAAVTTSVVLAALGASALALGAPAQADPTSGFRQFNGVGSDTTQDVVNAFAGDVSGVTGVTTKIGSYNAFGSAQIKTTASGPLFDRPSGSGAGVKALSDALTGTPYNGVNITGQVDFARSSSGPVAGGTQLTYIPFARDAVSYAYTGAAGKLGKLTTAQLKTVYSANSPVTINGVVITGVLPQINSGTRKFFLSAIGVTTVGSTVDQTTDPENDGSILNGRTNAVVPFSAAQWVAQKNGVVTNTTGAYLYGAPNGKPAISKNAAGKYSPVTGFYNTAPYGRSVYNVVATSTVGVAGSVASVFATTTSPLCKTAGKAISTKFGFAPINFTKTGQKCGDTNIQGALTP